MRAVVGPVGMAAAMTGAPAWGVRMVSVLAPRTSFLELVMPTTLMVSAQHTWRDEGAGWDAAGGQPKCQAACSECEAATLIPTPPRVAHPSARDRHSQLVSAARLYHQARGASDF